MDTSLHYLTMANQMLIQKRLLERVKASGLTLGQPKVLDYLKDHDGASQKEIAAGCFIEAGSLTSILNRMEEKGLIERRMLNGNRRTFHIFMTESGKKSQKLVEEAFVEIEEAAWKDISPEEAEAFMKIYHKIYSNLSETGCEETGKEGRNKLKRYVIFLIGLFVNSLGVSLITKASLGTSPISSIPYVLSLSFPFTLGNFTIFFSVFLILLQLLILRKNFKLEHVLQIPVSIIFGYFIDLTMLLFTWVNPQAYVMKIVYLLIGCLILGFGVYMEVLADVVMLPGESFVRAIVLTWKTNFGTTKICFDVSMAVIAAILSFVFTGHLNGVREGTIIAALLVGFIARVFGKKLAFVKPLLFPEEFAGENVESAGKSGAASVDKPADEVQRNVIVIGRQFGSGGHDIGKALAEKLGYAFYDQEIIEMTAGTTGYTPEFIQKKEEMMTSSFLYDLVNQMYMYAQPDEEAPKDKIYEAESKVVRELAAKGNCVIVGRCSDYTLRDNKNCLRVFFCAPMENRMKRVMDRLHLSEKDAKQKIQKEDKWRADNYRYYTGRIWGASANFDLTVNTALGEEYIEMCIREAMKR